MVFLVDLGVLMFLLTLLVGGLAVWRIGQVVSWHALAMTAWASRSFTDCVAFIRFCAEEREREMESGRSGQHGVWTRVGPRHVLEESPRFLRSHGGRVQERRGWR